MLNIFESGFLITGMPVIEFISGSFFLIGKERVLIILSLFSAVLGENGDKCVQQTKFKLKSAHAFSIFIFSKVIYSIIPLVTNAICMPVTPYFVFLPLISLQNFRFIYPTE